jgi:hypothetical protein
MTSQQRKETIEYAVLVISGDKKNIVPKNSKDEALDAVATYNMETPLFGDSVEAHLIARTKTVTVDFGNWGKVKPRS